MHSAHVLGEEVFPVKFIEGLLRRLLILISGPITRHASANIASVDTRTQVLGRYMAFPFIFGAET